MERMKDIFINRKCMDTVEDTIQSSDPSDIMKNILIEYGFDTGEELLQRLQQFERILSSSLESSQQFKLIIIDSIAYLFRDLGDDVSSIHNLSSRSSLLFRISALLR